MCLKLFLDHFLRIHSQRWNFCFTQYEHSNDSWYIANLLSQMIEPIFGLQQCMKVKFHCTLACDFSFLSLLCKPRIFFALKCWYSLPVWEFKEQFRMSDVWLNSLSPKEKEEEKWLGVFDLIVPRRIGKVVHCWTDHLKTFGVM